MRLSLVVLLLLVAACDCGGVRRTQEDVSVAPLALQFGDAFVGYPKELSVTVSNRATARRTLALTFAGSEAFSAAVGELEVPGGSTVDLPVRFAPTAAGAVTGTLTLADSYASYEVALSGTGVAVPACSTSIACRVSTFDATAGTCIEANAPDTTACTSVCITGGSCVSGECIGTAASCGDSNACTVDACDPVRGCSHVPVQCPAATNPCKVALCDAVTGCGEADARDGTACGPADCVTANVCLLGECKALAVPNGTECGEASPCQPKGMCNRDVCERPAAVELTELWHHDFPTMQGSFSGVVDAMENLYWVECMAACRVISKTRDGAWRFSTVISTLTPPEHFIAGDELVYARDNVIGAVALADGAPRWSLSLGATFPNQPDAADRLIINGFAGTSTGLVVSAYRYSMNTPRAAVVLRVTSSGATALHFYPGGVSGPVVDELDNVYFALETQQQYVSLSSGGAERWRVPATPLMSNVPIAAFNGEVLLGNGEVRSSANGALRVMSPGADLLNGPLMLPTARRQLHHSSMTASTNLLSFAPGATAMTWDAKVLEDHAQYFSDPIASLNGNTLVGASGTRHPAVLKSISSTGVEQYACDLPSGIVGSPLLQPGVALLDGRWVTLGSNNNGDLALRVFAVPGEKPPARGWATTRGSAAGARKPLP